MSKLNLSLAILSLVAILFSTPARSFADTYSILGIETDKLHYFYGMDDSWHVTFSVGDAYSYLHCGFSASSCYETLTYSVDPIYTVSAPTYTWDFASTNACFTLPFAPTCSATDNGRTVTYTENFSGPGEPSASLTVSS